MANRDDHDAAPRRPLSAQGRKSWLAWNRRVALNPPGAAWRCAAYPGHRARSDPLALPAGPRHGAHPGRGAEPEWRDRDEPQADEFAERPGSVSIHPSARWRGLGWGTAVEDRHRLGSALQPSGSAAGIRDYRRCRRAYLPRRQYLRIPFFERGHA